MLFKKNQIKKFETFTILLFFFVVTTSSCSRKKVTPQKAVLASYEFPTKNIQLDCKKAFESLTLLLQNTDLKKVSFKKNFIKTHWIDNTFSFFSKEEEKILDKSAKFRLYLKGKPSSKNKKNCKLAIFKNQKVKYSHSSPWVSTPSDLNLEKEIFSKLTEGGDIQSNYLQDEDSDDESLEEDSEENGSETIEEVEEENSSKDETEEIESIESIESIEGIEGIEKVEKYKEEKNKIKEDEGDEESIESIESLES